ncbi:MAG: hypothetical protein JOZ52_14685 [Acidobacteria bacterium]|nr:hypothetical protein [Acidobacteriota bacterium]
MKDKRHPNKLVKLAWSLPWLTRYPFWRAREAMTRASVKEGEPQHLIVVVANHFEPSWNEQCAQLDWNTQLAKLDRWCEQARAIGEAVRDADGTPFRHTNFYPAEQYHPRLLQRLSELQAEGFGEVEVHLHHGVEEPDTEENLRRALVDFRDTLAEEHQCLSREGENAVPKYAFVHGNLALANSAGGRCCGVDAEMRVLAETGCYADMTLPSAPDQSQVARINALYQCGHDLNEAKPHRSGRSLRVGEKEPPQLPIIFTGPLVFNWNRKVRGLPVPRLDDGALTANQPLDLGRLNRWRGARIHVAGQPQWIFIKLYCHGFFHFDQPSTIGERVRKFWEEAIEHGERTGEFKIHFASAREAFNIALAATDGRTGEPGLYRDYRLKQIMRRETTRSTGTEG